MSGTKARTLCLSGTPARRSSHLTNDAVQEKFEHYGTFEDANKLSMEAFQELFAGQVPAALAAGSSPDVHMFCMLTTSQSINPCHVMDFCLTYNFKNPAMHFHRQVCVSCLTVMRKRGCSSDLLGCSSVWRMVWCLRCEHVPLMPSVQC